MRNEAGTRGTGQNQDGPIRSWDLDQLPWPEVGRILARNPRLILPVGALVQHGPHLPLGTNSLIVHRVGKAASREFEVLLAPTFSYGVWKEGKEGYAGASGIRRKTLHRALNELLAGWEDHGIQEFLLLTAHQLEPHLDALLMAMTSSGTTTVVNLLTIDTADLLDAPPYSEHGGELETSLLLHLAPDLVHLDQAADVPSPQGTYGRYAHGRAATPPPGSRGTLGYPSRASARKGEAVFKRYVAAVGEILAGEPSNPGPGIKEDDNGREFPPRSS